MGRPLLAPDGTSDSAAIADSLARPEGFATIFDRHHVAVHRYLARRAPRAQADDLASMTFVVAFERRASFRPHSTSALPWLLGIATNLMHERHRAERRQQGALVLLSAERATDAHSAEHDAGGEELDTDRLARALATLDSAQLDVLLLHAWEELTYEQIAEALDVPIGTVRSRLARARAHLRSRLQEPRACPDPCPDPSPDPSAAPSPDPTTSQE
jgi:RNA polymerase sigma-70 factor (ECF subfamily)